MIKNNIKTIKNSAQVAAQLNYSNKLQQDKNKEFRDGNKAFLYNPNPTPLIKIC